MRNENHMNKRKTYRIHGMVKTATVGERSFSVTVKSTQRLGAAIEQFERDNPDCRVTSADSWSN